jgi:hypothetical protein
MTVFPAFEADFKADFDPFRGPLAVCRRTHARNPCNSARRTIHKLLNANNVFS